VKGEKIAAKEKGIIKKITIESIFKKGNGGDIAGNQAIESVGIETGGYPDAKISDNVKNNR
jgi:hypothetical protein